MSKTSAIGLISPPASVLGDDGVDAPLGLLYIGTVLKECGYEVTLYDFAGGRKHRIVEHDYYCFTTYTPTYGWTMALRDGLRWQYPDARFVAGGAHVSALPVLDGWDYIVIGEGEEAIERIVAGDVPLPSVVAGTPVESLDVLPCPDYGLLSDADYTQQLHGRSCRAIVSSRGCPYHCAFCNSNIYHGKPVRFRSVEHIAGQIEGFLDDGIAAVKFVDDFFCASSDRLESLTTMIARYDVIYRCQTRIPEFTNSVANMLSASGCVAVTLGAESGSDLMLKLMRKMQTVAQIKAAVAAAKSADLEVWLPILVGFPGETWDTLRETRDMILECEPTTYTLLCPIPYPGTDIGDNPAKYGIDYINPNLNEYYQIRANGERSYLYSYNGTDEGKVAAMHEWLIGELAALERRIT